MRIAYTCHDSFPSASTNTQQIFWTILEVARLGVEVTLIVPAIDAAAGGDPRVVIAAHYGVAADAVPPTFSVVGARKPRVSGRIGEGWFDWRAPRRLSRQSFDLIWTRDPLAVTSSVRAGWPTLFETYRPDFASRPRFAIWRAVTLHNPHLHGIIVHSRMAADAFQLTGVPADRCLVAHNGFAPALMQPVLTQEQARARLRQLDVHADRPLVVYTGHAGREKGMEALVRVAAAVPRADFLIVGAGAGEETRQLETFARSVGAANLRLHDRVPLADVATYLYAADLLIVPPTDAPLRHFRRTVLPMKLFSYLAAGRPILAPRLPDIEEVLTDGDTARLVTVDDPVAAATALNGLLDDAALRQRLGDRARAAASRYTWAARARTIVAFLDRQFGRGFSSSAAAASSR